MVSTALEGTITRAPFSFRPFEEHVHCPQVQGGRVMDVRLGGLSKRVGDLLLRFAQDDACLALALGLRLAGHGVFQVLWDDHIADLDRLHGDAPGGGALVDDLLQLGIHLGPPDQDICQGHLPNDLAQRGLGSPGDGGAVVGHFQGGFLGIPHQPEQHRIHIDRDGVLGQRFFGAERCHHDAVVDPVGEGIDDGDNPKQPWPGQPLELTQVQHDRFFPLVGDLKCQHDVRSDQG